MMELSETIGRKIGPLPLWAWAVLAGGVVMLASRGAKKSAAAGDGSAGGQFNTSQTFSGTNAAGEDYSTTYSASGTGSPTGILTYGPGNMPIQGGDIYNNYPVPPNGPPDQYSPSGQNVGQYRFGSDQLAYLEQNKGQKGITDSIISDVRAAYNAVSDKHGQGQANMYHYSWIGPGNVQAIPPYVNSAQDIVVGLP